VFQCRSDASRDLRRSYKLLVDNPIKNLSQKLPLLAGEGWGEGDVKIVLQAHTLAFSNGEKEQF